MTSVPVTLRCDLTPATPRRGERRRYVSVARLCVPCVLILVALVVIFSPNHVGASTFFARKRMKIKTSFLFPLDYAPAIWATHRLGGIVSSVALYLFFFF